MIAQQTDCLYQSLKKYMYSKQTDIWQAVLPLHLSARSAAFWSGRRGRTADPRLPADHQPPAALFPQQPVRRRKGPHPAHAGQTPARESSPSKSCCTAGSDRTAGCPTKTSAQSAGSSSGCSKADTQITRPSISKGISALTCTLWIEISKHIHI